jgi:hypothetical protein
MKYVANYPVRAVLDGEKKVFKAGETVTGLSDPDINGLLKSGVIEAVNEPVSDVQVAPTKPKSKE